MAAVFAIGLCSCGGGSGSSETNTERSAIKGTELSRQEQAADADNNSSDKNTEIPVLGGWRALELKKGSDTETDNRFEYVLLLGEDGQYRMTYEKAKKYEYKDGCLYLYQGEVLDYLKYTIQSTGNGYIIKPIAFSYQNSEYNIEEYNNKHKLDPMGAPVHLSDKPSYELRPYEGRYRNAEEEYTQSLEIYDLKTLNGTAKYVFNAVSNYFYKHGTDRKSYNKYAGEYSKNSSKNELSKVIAEALSETKSMDVECCLITVLNEDTNEYIYYIQTKAKGHSQIGQYPEPREASFDNPSLSSGIVYGTYTKLSE